MPCNANCEVSNKKCSAASESDPRSYGATKEVTNIPQKKISESSTGFVPDLHDTGAMLYD